MDYHDDDDEPARKKRFTEFDCPDCNANNPNDGFRFGDEVLCYYCGNTFLAADRDNKLKLKPL